MAGRSGGSFVLSIDQGTTSTRALLFDKAGEVHAMAQRPLRQYYPEPAWVEHDPEEILSATLAVAREVIAQVEPAQIAGIGITNQRETSVLWARETGRAIAPAIVWQDRRTTGICEALRAQGREDALREKTGLLADPYFSGTKLQWLLNHTPGARAMAQAGALAFGTIDSWLIYRLTGGKVHATDATNASRTLLYNVSAQAWDEEILQWLSIPRSVLPRVVDSAGIFGTTEPSLLGRSYPIAGVAGDQQAAVVGQACFEPGYMKATFGTGAFALVNTGGTLVRSRNRLLSTIGYRIGGRTHYALEGSIFMAGATIQWLRDGLKIIRSAAESAELAASADPKSEVHLVPAFTGLGAPYWDPHARGAILGLTRDSGAAEIAKAALQSVSFQMRDLVDAMADDMAMAGLVAPSALRVDGGMAQNDWFCQNLADILGRPVERPAQTETTAAGAAGLAFIGLGIVPDLKALGQAWRLDRRFEPLMGADARETAYAGWRKAVARVLSGAV